MEINRAFLKYLENEEQEADFKAQALGKRLILAVLYRFILDALHATYVKQLKMPVKDRDATLELMRSLGEQRVLYKLAELFSAFGLDDHPLIKSATHVKKMGSIKRRISWLTKIMMKT